MKSLSFSIKSNKTAEHTEWSHWSSYGWKC